MVERHFTYQYTNTITKEYYIGKHTTLEGFSEGLGGFFEDEYEGSSSYLTAAFDKYGRENFELKILDEHDTSDDAYTHEGVLVTWDTVDDPLCYNAKPGGKKGDEPQCKPVIQFTAYTLKEFEKMGIEPKNYRVARFESASEANSSVSTKGNNGVTKCANGQKSFKGFQWFYESDVIGVEYTGPVERDADTGGKTTIKKLYLKPETGELFETQRASFKSFFPNGVYSGTKWKKKCSDKLIELTEEEYERLKNN